MVKIVTVYNSLNPGSFFQATSLYKVLENKYGDVSFLKTKARNPYLSGLKVFLKLLKSLNIKYAFREIKMPVKYSKALNGFQINNQKSDNNTVYIIGSDEIWNESRKDFSKYPIFWGVGLPINRCIAYAPSVNYAKIEDFSEKPHITKALENFNMLSVRDNYSKSVINCLTNRDIAIVCDPVMLLPIQSYREMYTKLKREYKYVLVYGPERHFSSEDVEIIKQYAIKHNLKILSYYFWHNWADDVLFGNPYEFLELIDDSEKVITSTFHGTIFSIMYNKSFAIFGDNQKVKEVLKQFGLTKRVHNTGGLEEIFSEKIDYNPINEIIGGISNESRSYLYNSIDNIVIKNKKDQ